MKKPLRAAVIGVGYLGRLHAQKYAALDGAELVAVVDSDAARAHAVAEETGTAACTDYRSLLGRIDVASVVVPTSQHFEVARELLAAGVHVLVEKPIAATVDEARALVELAEAEGRVLQVGHLERFNPVMTALLERVEQPMFIESHRLAPFKPRGTDVSVVLDLMIHDLDLIQMLVGAPIRRIDASGLAVLSSTHMDIANARIQFANGCVANATVSRVSQKGERRLRLFQHNAYLAADFSGHILDVARKLAEVPAGAELPIELERISVPKGDALLAEIEAFVHCAREGKPPLVSGRDGLQALQTALEVIRQAEANPLPGQQEHSLEGINA
jgi:predicted dehydrogenase